MWNAPGLILPEGSTFRWYYVNEWLPDQTIAALRGDDDVIPIH
jgi:hypothetical protein